jgi:hypothetical protein
VLDFVNPAGTGRRHLRVPVPGWELSNRAYRRRAHATTCALEQAT